MCNVDHVSLKKSAKAGEGVLYCTHTTVTVVAPLAPPPAGKAAISSSCASAHCPRRRQAPGPVLGVGRAGSVAGGRRVSVLCGDGERWERGKERA